MARILIADDDVDYLDVFCDGMRTMGHEVTPFTSGDQVVEAMKTHAYDIIFLDVLMARGGAISILHDVRIADPVVPVVIITGRAEMANSPVFRHGLRQAQAKLQKTTTLGELDAVVRSLTAPPG
ncbi:response regulator [Pseudoroseicyclus sp. CXY001]|uniref:response regulator n=1 Tax=Pseudoroseicyclus sp. CXY001 TaxID=3242492 RepID=UPI00357110D1